MELRTVVVNEVNLDVYFVESDKEIFFKSVETQCDATNIMTLLSTKAFSEIESQIRVSINKPLTEAQFKKIHPYGTYLGYLAWFKEQRNPIDFSKLVFDVAGFIAVADENRKAGYTND